MQSNKFTFFYWHLVENAFFQTHYEDEISIYSATPEPTCNCLVFSTTPCQVANPFGTQFGGGKQLRKTNIRSRRLNGIATLARPCSPSFDFNEIVNEIL